MRRIGEKKAALRADCKARRAALAPEEKMARDEKIARHFLESSFYRQAEGILFYSAKTREVETAALIDRALSDGKRVALPRCLSEGEMAFFEIRSRAELEKGKFGLLEPPAGLEAVDLAEYDVCVLPGLAFDWAGRRLGYGRGYYDRYLRVYTGRTVALCHAEFVKRRIPADKFDLPVDLLVTEKGVLTARKLRRFLAKKEVL